MNLFLNEQSKYAMNIKDFVKNVIIDKEYTPGSFISGDFLYPYYLIIRQSCREHQYPRLFIIAKVVCILRTIKRIIVDIWGHASTNNQTKII